MSCHYQCGLDGIFFSRVDPNRFAYPQIRWPVLPWSFILFRIFYAGYQITVCTLILLFWGVTPYYNPVDCKAKWFVYVSNWGYFMTTVYAFWTATTTIYWHMRGEKRNDPGFFYYNKETEEKQQNSGKPIEKRPKLTERGRFTPPMPWYFKLTWLLQVIACSSQLAGTVFFWVLNYELEDYYMNFFTTNVHGISLALVTVDFLISANPCRVLHVVYTGLFGLMYYAFTYVYQDMGGLNTNGTTNIYEGVLDWTEKPIRTALVGIVVVVVGFPSFHIVYFFLYLIKLALAACCNCCFFQKPDRGAKS